MQSYSDFPYTGNDNCKLWSSFTNDGGSFNDLHDSDDKKLYSSIFPTITPPHHFTNSTSVPPIVVDYSRRHSLDFAPFQDLIDRRNWCLTNLKLTTKEAEALRQENVNLQIANCELSKQLSQLQQQAVSISASASGYGNTSMLSKNSICDRFGRMRIGEKGKKVSDKRGVARGAENVDPVKKTDVERVKLPKSISVRSNVYLKTGQSGDGVAPRVRALDRAKTAADMQKVYICGKKEEEPLELQVFNQGMTKTELCNKWQQTGACPYGDHCQFAHGIEELRPVIRHPRYKTEVCRMVLAGDPCPYGHRCHFRHALTQEEKLMNRR
uniref:zinc finger CCCH domain-containing protein 15 n=1 Tax=Erigeron canadensis TaxID=72917 RepID=UPI001CB9C36C|nr:zinc finger CCCH domain-containing protein 15 [Erigeron canadensis]